MSARNVAVIVGSLRKESFNRKLANAVIAIAPDTLAMTIVPIGDLPLYNQDLETESPPVQWTAFRDAIRGVDRQHFAVHQNDVGGRLRRCSRSHRHAHRAKDRRAHSHHTSHALPGSSFVKNTTVHP